MPATMEELGIDKWSAEDRRHLAESIWLTLEDDEPLAPEPEFEEWEKLMIDERIAAAEAHPELMRPAKEVFDRLLGR
jgi:hypothetical protein